jgi:energy-coupling factor transporter transmembrane protein EcfT
MTSNNEHGATALSRRHFLWQSALGLDGKHEMFGLIEVPSATLSVIFASRYWEREIPLWIVPCICLSGAVACIYYRRLSVWMHFLVVLLTWAAFAAFFTRPPEEFDFFVTCTYALVHSLVPEKRMGEIWDWLHWSLWIDLILIAFGMVLVFADVQRKLARARNRELLPLANLGEPRPWQIEGKGPRP